MKYTHILIKFGEMFLKGKNRFFFINTLYKNIKISLKNIPNLNYEILSDHIIIGFKENSEVEKIINILKNVSGIYSISIILQTKATLDDMTTAALSLIKQEAMCNKTFKIFCKRNDKTFKLKSDDIIRHIADKILETTDLLVDVHKPDIKFFVEIRKNKSYIFTEKNIFYGQGGFPSGTNGKVLMMLSGGIDSPVASYMLMKKGMIVDFIHFASPPYTSEAVIDKIKDILNILKIGKPYKIKLYIVNFTEIQKAVYQIKDTSYAITLLRRMMYRIANKLAGQFDYLALANGDSIGQVSSQTLESINVIENFEELRIPVLRPLCIFDKIDIIKIAKEIKTYDISIRPYEDCCTIFSTKTVRTKPNINEVISLEKNIDFSLLDKALKNIETIFLD